MLGSDGLDPVEYTELELIKERLEAIEAKLDTLIGRIEALQASIDEVLQGYP